MDRRERWAEPVEALRAALDGRQAEMWTALPGIVQSFDPAAMTVSVQPAVAGRISDEAGKAASVDLPILPDHWQMVVGKDKKKQFDVLKRLMNAPDVTEVVNACDAGREGELIFRAVYELAGCTKPMKRLWISSMEDSAIREGFENLRPGAS